MSNEYTTQYGSNVGNVNETGHGHGQKKGGLMQGLKEGVQAIKENVQGSKAAKHGDHHADHNTSANTYGTNTPLGGGVATGTSPGYGAEDQQAYGTTGTTGTQGYSSGLTGTGTQGGYSSGLTGTGGTGVYNTGNTGYGNVNESGHHSHGQEKGGLMQGLKEGTQKVKENVQGSKGKHDDYNTSSNTYGTNAYGTNAPLGGYAAEGQQAYGTGTTGTQGYSSGLTGSGTQAGYSSGLAGTGGAAGYGTEAGHHGHGQEKGGLMQGLKEGAQKVKENVSNKDKHDNYNTSANTYGTNAPVGYGAEGQQAYGTGTQGGYPSTLAGTGAGVYNTNTGLSGGVGQGGVGQGQEYASDNLQSQNAGLTGGRVQRSEY